MNNNISKYKQVQNFTDTKKQMSIRAVKSVLLYCQDWSDETLTLAQRYEALHAGKTICDEIVLQLRDDLPKREQMLLYVIFSKTSDAIFECFSNPHKSLMEAEHALIQLIDLMENK